MLNINELTIATKGKYINGDLDVIPLHYVIDSRELENNDFFIPIVGEKADGHNYIIDVVKKGAIGFFISSKYSKKEEIINESKKINKNICIIEVEDTQISLYEAAKFNRNKHINIPVVAVTGSVGKTSTREMIASVLGQENTLLVTRKNYNSYIGAPIMVLEMDKQDVSVLEVGIDKIGEMEILSQLLKPDICVITMIGTAHIGVIGSRENIFKEKLKITNYIKGMKTLIINEDDEFLKTIKNEEYNVYKFGMGLVNDIVYKEDEIVFETEINGKNEKITINEMGKHNIYNALCAIKVANCFNMKTKNIIEGIGKYKNFSKRLEKKKIGNDILIIDDTYNASIDSMKSGLEASMNITGSGRKIAVLGDMLELGEYSSSLHEEVGKTFDKLKYDKLVTLGKESKNIAKIAKRYMKDADVICFEDRDELIRFLKDNIKSGDVLYFKASNGMKFFNIIEALEKEFNK